MKAQVLSLDLMNSVVGFLLIVGLVVLIINNSNLISSYEYEMFKMKFLEANRITFSSMGLLDEKGYMRTGDVNLIRIDIKKMLGPEINITLYVNNNLIGPDECSNADFKISLVRYLIDYSGNIYNVNLIGCKFK